MSRANGTSRSTARGARVLGLAGAQAVAWYARHGYDPSDIEDRRAAEPWYAAKNEPAFEDLAWLRGLLPDVAWQSVSAFAAAPARERTAG